ncbi:hypothetical protein BCR33DRAFT_324974 [Rhizoclosmatium globosum]|uniref:Ig-like domain-containing protein n=1 Tax=Rhizoclosmatium globosum TaxID=329046 RepID=A0A1Y2D055_9FUNG|nr:hypothetical protein BCR33DRAFT_324974 [Rhizoclosmatium globosum]|eukprot:ORY52658.1 hypothetical protein BCR33DRAFT_324974 [Rhizoclosmatium globosum]
MLFCFLGASLFANHPASNTTTTTKCMSFTITTSRRSRAGSESSITSSISSGSSVCSCSSSSATTTTTAKYSLVAADCSTHFPRRVASDADLVNKPILRRQNSGILKHSPSSPALSIAQKPKRISFSSESLCLFNNEESPRQVGAGSVYAKPITQPHTPSNLADLVLVADPSEDNDIPSWAVISSTTPSPIAPILSLLKSSRLRSNPFESSLLQTLPRLPPSLTQSLCISPSSFKTCTLKNKYQLSLLQTLGSPRQHLP